MRKKQKFRIKNRIIGLDFPPIVIAEIGINHNGSIDKAIQMIDDAFNAGCECVKFQYHIPNKEMIPNKVVPGNSNKTIWEIISKAKLSFSEEKKIKNYVDTKKMIYLSTPFSREAANKLNELGVKWFKIGSEECNNIPLIEHICKFKKPIILSTGMNDIQSIKKSVKIIEKNKINYALLHCTSMYPCPEEKINLFSILDLKKNFPNAVLGFSDHSVDNLASLASIPLGCRIIEKHFTSNKKWPGPDNIMSINKNELEQLIKDTSKVYKSLGHEKRILPEERKTINFAYSSIVSIKNIKKNEKLTLKNIWVKRPGLGDFLAKDFSKVLGKRVKSNIKVNSYILKEHIQNEKRKN